MKIDPRRLIGPLAAFLLLALTLQQTSDALRRSGAWQSEAATAARAPSPFARLDEELTRRTSFSGEATARDPFEYRASQTPRPTQNATPRTRPAPPPPAKPVLTAIIFDNDPRALVRFDGRDYTVRDNSLFSDYRVVRITRDEVVLDKGGVSLVLRRPTGGS